MTSTPFKSIDQSLSGTRILSVALNLPGPAALMRLADMGAKCSKLEPLGASDPMSIYAPKAYAQLHAGVKVVQADLKTEKGQAQLHKLLAHTDVLLTSFRPSALKKLGMAWPDLHAQFPSLNMVSIVGSPGAGAEIPGHDLTYLAASGLVNGLALPATKPVRRCSRLCGKGPSQVAAKAKACSMKWPWKMRRAIWPCHATGV